LSKKSVATAPSTKKKSRSRTRKYLTPSEIETVFSRLSAERPDPKTELEYSNPFTLLVAVVLSAQATDISVNRATRELFRVADTPEKMIALGEEEIGRHIRTIGLWRMKARNVLALSQILVDQHHSSVPRDRDHLEQLPGVGRKTANVVLSEAFGETTIAVDTHVFRVANRVGLAHDDTPDKVEKRLLRVTPAAYRKGAHHWLILHGRYTCTARSPKCRSCTLASLCLFPEKTQP
jgi:endonuclease-3